MKEYKNDLLEEKYYIETLDNGLKLILVPKPEFYTSYGILSVKYGSKDTEFIPYGKTEYVISPEGIAHFLEHKLFERENGIDVTNLFSNLGASVNAFTTIDQTAYLFSTTSDFEKSLELLLDFVQKPYFSKKGINKERGIIEQELMMYLDNPSNRLYYGILQNFYKNNKIKNEIGGTVSSIKEIDETWLYTCHETFYQPSNMTLVVAGRFDINETLKLIKENQSKKEFKPYFKIIRKEVIEPKEINKTFDSIKMDVTIPKVATGIKFKYDNLNPITSYKNFVALWMLVSIYLDESSSYYEELMRQGIINNSFGYSINCTKDYGYFYTELETSDEYNFINKMKEIYEIIKTSNITEKDFDSMKRTMIAGFISSFNSVEGIADMILSADNENIDIFEKGNIRFNITIDDILKARELFDIDNISSFVIYPENTKNHN